MQNLARTASFLLLLTAAALPLAAGAAEQRAGNDLVRADLLVDGAAIDPGATFPVGVRLRVEEGWHVYWRNAGDSGLPTEVEWKLPDGFAAGELLWPIPEIFWAGPIINYGYEGEVILLADVRAPAQPGAGPFAIGADVSWLVCNPETCIPGKASLRREVEAGAADDRAALAAARERLPRPAPWKTTLRADADSITLGVEDPSLEQARIASAYFFAHDNSVLEHGAKQELARGPRGLELRLKPSELAEAPPKVLEGVLVLEEDLGGSKARQGFTVRAEIPSDASAAGAIAPAGSDAVPAAPALGLLEVLGLALLGGIVLNLMPCVFPVLSLKVLGVAQQATESKARVRLHGIAYTVGILVSFAALAGLLLALRAGGEEIGWGFQLQSPIFVAVLAYVMLAMALSLSGVVEFGGSIMGVGSSLAARPGLSGSFFTGVLATVVATPCTAPFMGAALGYAILQPAPIAMGIFLCLGFGLALPFLLLSFVPGLHRRMPRPGAWMEKLKQALAFPLYGTVAWLVWVLHLQVGSEGLAAVLAGLVLIGFAAWAWGASRTARAGMRRLGGAAGLAATLGAALLIPAPPDGPVAQAAASAATTSGPSYEPWSEARLEELRAAGKPVFVNFTAAWCVTCLVNERTAMATEGVRALFAEKGIAYLKGDWTNRDPAITRTLEKFGRTGVPLYLYYPAGAKEPVVLPQILTEATVREHLDAG